MGERAHVYPELGRHKVSDVLFPDLQDLVDDLAADGLDGSTITNAINPLRVIYRPNRYAIPVNPTTGLELPALGNKPKRVVSADVAVQIIDTLEKGDRARRAAASSRSAALWPCWRPRTALVSRSTAAMLSFTGLMRAPSRVR